MSGPLRISSQDKLLFIESYLIPSFDPDNELDSSRKRKEWMKTEVNNWDVGLQLIRRYGTVANLDEAKGERTKVEKVLENEQAIERNRGVGHGVPIVSSSGSETCLLEGKFEEMKVSSGGASGFTASQCKIAENCGFSATFPCPFMQPKIISDHLSAVNEVLSEQELKSVANSLEESLTISILPYKIHETNQSSPELCVESISGEALKTFFEFHPTNVGLLYKRQMYLNELVTVSGVATDSSHSDGIVHSEINSNKIGSGVVELKDTAFAPLEQHGQIHATGANLCLGQLKHGLPREECCVAFLSSNGQLFQFGFITLLHPSFPVMHVTSPVIDAHDPVGLQLAAKHLHAMREFCRKQDTRLRNCTTPAVGRIYVALDDVMYYQKPISRVFKRCNSQLQSVLHMYKIFQRLYEHGVEEAVLPVAIRSGKLNQRDYLSSDYLLFPMLPGDFHMGVPCEDEDFDSYLVELTKAYRRMHAAGVVHLDGYPSNVLWRKQESGIIVIRFVDFDVASFLNQNFDFGIQKLLDSSEFAKTYYYWGGDSQKARMQHDAWFVFCFSRMTKQERVASNEAGQVKSVEGVVASYWNVVRRLRSVTTIKDEFETWLQNNWHAQSADNECAENK